METIDDLDFEQTKLPVPMRHLVPYYRLYAFSDDAIRERLIQEATPAEFSPTPSPRPSWKRRSSSSTGDHSRRRNRRGR